MRRCVPFTSALHHAGLSTLRMRRSVTMNRSRTVLSPCGALADGGDVVVTVRRSKTNQAGDHPDCPPPAGGGTAPEPGDSVVGLSVDQVNRRFAAACAAAGLEGRRTSHGGRVGLAAELTARGAATHAVQLAGGWKDASMVVRYAASVATRAGAVSRYMREHDAAGAAATRPGTPPAPLGGRWMPWR